jgi:very-short-patch-repair endonuclease
VQFPDLYELTLPMLASVSDGADWSTRRLLVRLADEFALSDDELAATRSDGKLVFLHRVERARKCLEKAGLVECVGPQTVRITDTGVRLLATRPQLLGWSFFVASEKQAGGSQAGSTAGSTPETLEDELRALCGPVAADERAWEAIRSINGWSPDPPTSYKRVAAALGFTVKELLSIGRSCCVVRPKDAPLLDSTLELALSRQDLDPDALSLDLAFAGITRDGVSLPGLCEAARRFGRVAEWHELLRYMAGKRGFGQRPRPFESWFELDVFLCLVDLGYEVQPQVRIGRYRVDMLLPDFTQPMVVECDGERFHGEERRERDESRELWLQNQDYQVLRLGYLDFTRKRQVMKDGLADMLRIRAKSGMQMRIHA